MKYIEKKEGTILGSIIEYEVKQLMIQYELSAYEAISVALQIERNTILKKAFVIVENYPGALEKIAMELSDN